MLNSDYSFYISITEQAHSAELMVGLSINRFHTILARQRPHTWSPSKTIQTQKSLQRLKSETHSGCQRTGGWLWSGPSPPDPRRSARPSGTESRPASADGPASPPATPPRTETPCYTKKENKRINNAAHRDQRFNDRSSHHFNPFRNLRRDVNKSVELIYSSQYTSKDITSEDQI